MEIVRKKKKKTKREGGGKCKRRTYSDDGLERPVQLVDVGEDVLEALSLIPQLAFLPWSWSGSWSWFLTLVLIDRSDGKKRGRKEGVKPPPPPPPPHHTQKKKKKR